MKADKAVCTSPPLAAHQELGAGDAAVSGEVAMAKKDQERGGREEKKSKYVDKTEQYGMVFSTLLENKIQAIKRQSEEYAAAKLKRQQHQSPRRLASKFIPNCVRRNSLPAETKGTNDAESGDVEMGLIGVGCIGANATNGDIIQNSDLPGFAANELSSTETKNQSDTFCYNTSLQSINSIGTAFSLPTGPANKQLTDVRSRIFDAKSVSAQASPVLPRTQTDSMSITSQPKHTEPTSSRSLVPIRTTHRLPLATTTATNTSSSLHGGFISNFNELASSNNLSNLMNINLPVISSTISHHHHAKKMVTSSAVLPKSCVVDTATGYRPTVSTTLEYEQRTDRRWPYASANEMLPAASSAADSGSVGSGRQEWKTSRRKFRHRGSDPSVLIYPSSSGLSQCLLTMPPNRSIQLKYDDNTMYDVSLEVDQKSTKKNGTGGPRSGHKSTQRHQLDGFPHHHHHHHHRHHHHSRHHDGEKRSRRHRKRILVHDLDTQRVKVIDPDDLSQRARWTIIATACLLLIMCLLLVGITLRMAPLIDDMVRQENERLMKESYERSRFLRNLTDEIDYANGA